MWMAVLQHTLCNLHHLNKVQSWSHCCKILYPQSSMHIQTVILQSMPVWLQRQESLPAVISLKGILKKKKKNSTTNESERRTNLVLVAWENPNFSHIGCWFEWADTATMPESTKGRPVMLGLYTTAGCTSVFRSHCFSDQSQILPWEQELQPLA